MNIFAAFGADDIMIVIAFINEGNNISLVPRRQYHHSWPRLHRHFDRYRRAHHIDFVAVLIV
jgi:hypothetical protein